MLLNHHVYMVVCFHNIKRCLLMVNSVLLMVNSVFLLFIVLLVNFSKASLAPQKSNYCFCRLDLCKILCKMKHILLSLLSRLITVFSSQMAKATVPVSQSACGGKHAIVLYLTSCIYSAVKATGRRKRTAAFVGILSDRLISDGHIKEGPSHSTDDDLLALQAAPASCDANAMTFAAAVSKLILFFCFRHKFVDQTLIFSLRLSRFFHPRQRSVRHPIKHTSIKYIRG